MEQREGDNRFREKTRAFFNYSVTVCDGDTMNWNEEGMPYYSVVAFQYSSNL